MRPPPRMAIFEEACSNDMCNSFFSLAHEPQPCAGQNAACLAACETPHASMIWIGCRGHGPQGVSQSAQAVLPEGHPCFVRRALQHNRKHRALIMRMGDNFSP